MTIKEVSEKFKISEDTLRYYEKEGLIHSVPRKSGKRNYGQAELDNIEFIVCMRGAGLSIEVLKEYIKLIEKGEETSEQRRNLLIEERKKLKKKLDDMNKAYQRLNYKIDVYYSHIKGKEQSLLGGADRAKK